MDLNYLRQFIAHLDTPFLPLGSTMETLGKASVIVRIVHRPGHQQRASISLELQAKDRCVFIDLAPVGMAYVHHFGWLDDETVETWEPVVGSEDLVDGILALANAPAVGPRVLCSGEWSVRARASAAVDELLKL